MTMMGSGDGVRKRRCAIVMVLVTMMELFGMFGCEARMILSAGVRERIVNENGLVGELKGGGGGSIGAVIEIEKGFGIGLLFFGWALVIFAYVLSKIVGVNTSSVYGVGGSRIVGICVFFLGIWVIGNVWTTVMFERSLSLLRCGQFFMAGGLCALITHAICVPIDVVKTRLQLKGYEGRYKNMMDGFVKIIKEEGVGALGKGLGATAWGYFLHGAFKYCGYEIFKVVLSGDGGNVGNPGVGISAGAGFLAECVACLLLCPMEAIRIRSVADSGFPGEVVAGLYLIAKTEGVFAGLYKGLPSILLKQVPYTVGQFVSYESAIVFVKFVAAVIFGIGGRGQAVPTKWVPIFATIAGFLAGIMAAFISHPGDTILSKVNQEASSGNSERNENGEDSNEALSSGSAWAHIGRVAKQQGFRGLFLGLGARLVQVSCIVGGQFLIYDSIKLWCGISPASALPSAAARGIGGGAVVPPS